MLSISESTKIFIQDICEYAEEGNQLIVKTPNLLISTRVIDPYVAWIVIYRKKKFSLTSGPGIFESAFTRIIRFMREVEGNNESDNS